MADLAGDALTFFRAGGDQNDRARPVLRAFFPPPAMFVQPKIAVANNEAGNGIG
jgi:hypothetical protein